MERDNTQVVALQKQMESHTTEKLLLEQQVRCLLRGSAERRHRRGYGCVGRIKLDSARGWAGEVVNSPGARTRWRVWSGC